MAKNSFSSSELDIERKYGRKECYWFIQRLENFKGSRQALTTSYVVASNIDEAQEKLVQNLGYFQNGKPRKGFRGLPYKPLCILEIPRSELKRRQMERIVKLQDELDIKNDVTKGNLRWSRKFPKYVGCRPTILKEEPFGVFWSLFQ